MYQLIKLNSREIDIKVDRGWMIDVDKDNLPISGRLTKVFDQFRKGVPLVCKGTVCGAFSPMGGTEPEFVFLTELHSIETGGK